MTLELLRILKIDGRRSQAGYTLVEVLVATAIGAIVMGAVTSIVVTTVISTNVATSRVDATTQVRDFQLNAYDDVARSALPGASGCGSQANPCTTQPMVLTGSRIPNQLAGSPSPYTVTYTWDPSQHLVVRQVSAGPSRPVATGVTSYAWYIDSSAGHPTVVVNLTVTVSTYNASYSESQSFRFYPRVVAS
jgi:prepilin-type N-terminal cleavage/methylation domain-containing protein